MRRNGVAIVAIGTLLGWSSAALGSDEPDEMTPGRVVVIRIGRLAKFVAKPPTGLTFDLPDAGNAPTTEGGTLAMFDTAGAAMDIFNLPAGQWKGLGNPPGSKGYRYKGLGSIADPCRTVLVTEKVVKGVCKGAGVDLPTPFAGTVGIVLDVGTDTKTYCAEFGGTETRNDTTLLRRRTAPAPGACPTPGGGTTTTSTSSSSTSSTSTSSTSTSSTSSSTVSTTSTSSTVSTTSTSSTVSTTSTSSTVSTTSTSSTTSSSACCNGAVGVGFASVHLADDCGDVLSANGMPFGDVLCSHLYVGGGSNTVPLPVPVPDLGEGVLRITSCAGQVATLGPTTPAETGSDRTCTDTGCLFNAPLPVPNASSSPTSTCAIVRMQATPMGTLDCATGDMDVQFTLDKEIFLTGDTTALPGIQPCPICSAGTCIGGPNNGMACTPGSSALGPAFPTSHDCPPDPMLSTGTISLLEPRVGVTTDTVTWTAVPSGSQSRAFCGFCRDADTLQFEEPAHLCLRNGMPEDPPCTEPYESCQQRDPGAFGPNGTTNRTITVIGMPAADILSGPSAATLTSVFCVPPSFNPTVDAAANLPGPGALAVPGALRLCADLATCP